MSLHLAIISDIHNRMNKLRQRNAIPDADVYIFPGDMTGMGERSELRAWREEVQRLLDQGKMVVAIPGNHEMGVEEHYAEALEEIKPDPANGFFWLLDSGCEIDGIKFWGSPWQPYFGGWAYNVKADNRRAAAMTMRNPPEKSLEEYWEMIPAGTDVLITHGPPYGIFDATWRGEQVGSTSLLLAVQKLKPQIHCFGHIHEGYGREVIGSTEFINASICTKQYDPINPVPVVSVSPRS